MSSNLLGIEEISESIELYDSKPKKVCEIFIYFVFFTLVIILIISCFVGMEQYIKVQGKIDNCNEEVALINYENGIIEKIHVENGQYIKKGDIIYTLKKDKEVQNYDYYKNKLEDINEKKSMLYMYLMYLKGKITDWEAYSDNNYYHEFTSRKKLIDGQCQSISDDEKNTFIEAEITKVYSEKEEYESQYSELQKCLDESQNEINKLEVIALADGKIEIDTSVFEGNVVTAGQQVGTIVSKKQDNFVIQAYVDETDVVNMKKNMKIKFDMNAYPAKEYSYIEGKIRNISDKAITSEIDGRNYFIIDIEVTDMKKLEENKDVDIKSGMTGTVKVLTAEKRFINILLEKLNFK